jgi:hypothetical protein
MTIINWVIAIFVAIMCGAILGFVQGFSMAAHHDVLAGVRVNFRFKLLTLFARPSAELSSGQTLVVFAFVILWLLIFLGSVAAAFFMPLKLGIDEAAPITVALFFVTVFIMWRVGRAKWESIAKHAV